MRGRLDPGCSRSALTRREGGPVSAKTETTAANSHASTDDGAAGVQEELPRDGPTRSPHEPWTLLASEPSKLEAEVDLGSPVELSDPFGRFVVQIPSGQGD